MGLEGTEGLTSRQPTLGAHVREEPSFQSTGEGPTWDLPAEASTQNTEVRCQSKVQGRG